MWCVVFVQLCDRVERSSFVGQGSTFLLGYCWLELTVIDAVSWIQYAELTTKNVVKFVVAQFFSYGC